GEQVRTGQTIAEMGNTGTDRVKLHFEIRRRGQPVDPLGYLPKLRSSAKQTCICTVIVLVHTAGGAGAESIATRWSRRSQRRLTRTELHQGVFRQAGRTQGSSLRELNGQFVQCFD